MEVVKMGTTDRERQIPLLPLRGLLVFPTMVLHLDVGREKSVKALEKAMVEDNLILLATQEEVHLEEEVEGGNVPDQPLVHKGRIEIA